MYGNTSNILIIFQAAVTDIQVVSNGFLTCGGDSSVKFVQITDSLGLVE